MDLDGLRAEMEEVVKARGMTLFHGDLVDLGHMAVALWNSAAEEPDAKAELEGFIAAAKAEGIAVLVEETEYFDGQDAEDARILLQEAGLDEEEHREIEERLDVLEGRDGELASVGFSYFARGVLFTFIVEAEWFHELNDIMDYLRADSDLEDDFEEEFE